ncbi:serine protease 52-like [Erythrolamprus reginae]|uniref:serine protease 52-like n=1 Tax=Erythrolamprus reginae TaxID=121349 RepID=UPI00396CE1B9
MQPNTDKDEHSEHSNSSKVPWLVNIYGNGRRCQGVILSSWWVLTAANCFLLMNPSQVELTGSHGRFSTNTVSQFLLHRGFSAWNTAPNNDLGLILLGQPADLRRQDMWPACIPKEQKPYDITEECRILEQSNNETTKLFLKITIVESLNVLECSKHWLGSTNEGNLCVERKNPPKHVDCKVPVGTPVVCSDPGTSDWEVMGIVSQSLHNCSGPILAAQVLTHLKWLKQERSLENPLQQELPSAIPEIISQTMNKTLSATQQVSTAAPISQTIMSLPVANYVSLTKLHNDETSTSSRQILPQTEKPENVKARTEQTSPVITFVTQGTSTTNTKVSSELSAKLRELSSALATKGRQSQSVVSSTIKEANGKSFTKKLLPFTAKPSSVTQTILLPNPLPSSESTPTELPPSTTQTDINEGLPVHLGKVAKVP